MMLFYINFFVLKWSYTCMVFIVFSILLTLSSNYYYRPVETIPENAEEVSLIEMDPEYESRRRERREAYNDEDGPTRNVQCASQ